jgi:three-Cys-motif partner protein
MAQRFGDAHTDQKLNKLEAYLKVYSTALKNQDFQLIYFDAFAGAGDIQIGSNEASFLDAVDEYSPFIEGSALRALKFGKAFDRYIFVDKRKKNVEALAALKDKYADISDRISIQRGDANKELQEFCSRTNWGRCRAVVFLDPFGNQVVWDTLDAIAATKAIDVWYLFPAGLGVHRQIGRDGSVHFTHGAALDRILGTSEWRTAFIKAEIVSDLFDGERSESKKVANPAAITEFMIGRMRGIFKGGVLDEWIPLGSKKVHMYSLLFAWGNPTTAACKLANTLARAVLRSSTSGRTK